MPPIAFKLAVMHEFAIDPQEAAEFFEDPRDEDDFDPACLPSCDGGMLFEDPIDPVRSRGRARFLAVYYRLNRAFRELARLDAGDPRRAEVLARIARLGEARDRLEDACAPFGFIGEPVMDGALVRDIVFTEPPRRNLDAELVEMRVAVPLPDGVEIDRGADADAT